MDFKRKKLIRVFYDIKAYINCYIIIDFSATELHKTLRVNSININPGNKINIKPTTSSNLTHLFMSERERGREENYKDGPDIHITLALKSLFIIVGYCVTL